MLATKILELTDVNVIRAAGGVVYRTDPSGETELAIIHRPAYDDWTLPKGKVEPDETPEDCAVREVREETGFRCEIERPLGCTAYVDRRGRDKVACYWLMEGDQAPDVPARPEAAGSPRPPVVDLPIHGEVGAKRRVGRLELPIS